jgi:hypothetical protein
MTKRPRSMMRTAASTIIHHHASIWGGCTVSTMEFTEYPRKIVDWLMQWLGSGGAWGTTE